MAPAILAAAHRAGIRAAFHLDHGDCDEAVFRAMRWGASSVMRDASALPLEENIAVTRNIARIAHDLGLDVEGELGHIGAARDGVSSEYTRPDEALQFCEETGVDALAVAVGTAHGHYKQAPVLALERIRALSAAVPAALVLHGGSGTGDENLARAVRSGIQKVNLATELIVAGKEELVKFFEDPNFDKWQLVPTFKKGYKDRLAHYVRLFDQAGRAWTK